MDQNVLQEALDLGVQSFGVSRPHQKKKTCLGPHVKYTNTNETDEQKKKKKDFK